MDLFRGPAISVGCSWLLIPKPRVFNLPVVALEKVWMSKGKRPENMSKINPDLSTFPPATSFTANLSRHLFGSGKKTKNKKKDNQVFPTEVSPSPDVAGLCFQAVNSIHSSFVLLLFHIACSVLRCRDVLPWHNSLISPFLFLRYKHQWIHILHFYCLIRPLVPCSIRVNLRCLLCSLFSICFL